MARTARVVLPDVPMHVIQRGNNKQPCFRGAADFRRLLNILGEQSGKTGCAVHAYVLMSNHIHLLVTPPRALAIGEMMKGVLQEYSQYFNWKHQRTGGLWEGRFRSSLVQSEDYFLVCQRYIELNPVRAGMAERPEDYKWSSYRCNGRGISDPIVSPHSVYLGLAESENVRRKVYRELFQSEIDDHVLQHIRDAVRGNRALGSAAFVEKIEAQTGCKMRSNHKGRPKKSAARP